MKVKCEKTEGCEIGRGGCCHHGEHEHTDTCDVVKCNMYGIPGGVLVNKCKPTVESLTISPRGRRSL